MDSVQSRVRLPTLQEPVLREDPGPPQADSLAVTFNNISIHCYLLVLIPKLHTPIIFRFTLV